jgi:hypothetical protein
MSTIARHLMYLGIAFLLLACLTGGIALGLWLRGY